MPQLRVTTGPSAGRAFTVPQGTSTIGRGDDAAIRLHDLGISRRHAVLENDGDGVRIRDLGSTNGTWVNGRELRHRAPLRDGDVVEVGSVRLIFQDATEPGYPASDQGRWERLPDMDPEAAPPPPPGAPDSASGGPARVRMGRIVLVGAAVQLVGWLAAAAFTFLAGRTLGAPAWLLAPSAAVVTGIVQAIVEAKAGPPAYPGGPAPRRRGVPVLAAIMTILLLGAGGYAATVGVRYAVGWVTGNEDQVGAERLVAPRSDASGRVRVTVTGVVDTANFTRVSLTVTNEEEQSATLTVYRNSVLTGGGTTLQGDPFKSGWPEDVPPGGTQQGHVTFPGHLPPAELTAQFSFLRVFVFGRFGDDDAIVIKDIALRAP